MVPDGWGRDIVGRFSNNACNKVMYVVVIVMICVSESREKVMKNKSQGKNHNFYISKCMGMNE